MMAPNFFSSVNAMKVIIESATDPAKALDELSPLLVDDDLRCEFWRQLSDPKWIRALDGHGLFQSSSSDEKRLGGVRHPAWHATNYLVRMAPLASGDVAGVLQMMKTDNWSVARAAIDAVKAMPAEYVATLVLKVIEWSKSGLLWHVLPDIADICVKLAAEPYTDIGLGLMRMTFSIDWAAEERNRRDEYWYIEEMNKKLIPAYVTVRSREMLGHLVTEFVKAMTADTHSGEVDPDESYDIARPAIEEHPQNSNYNTASKMIECVRLALEQTISGKHLTVDQAMSLLEPVPSGLRERFRLHLVNYFADYDPVSARQAIMINETLQVGGAKHEYARLVGDRFDILATHERALWLERVDKGPDIDSWTERFRKWNERKPSDAEIRGFIHYWQFTRLHWVRQHLTGDRLTRYESLLNEIGDTRLTDLNVSTGWGGHNSPFSDTELADLTFEQLIEKVCAWKVEPTRLEGPDHHGLLNAFGRWIGERVEKIAGDAMLLQGRPADFVVPFISQLTEVIKQRKKISLEPALALCKWVVDQDVTEAQGDKDWNWARAEISRLLETICGARVTENSKTPLYPLKDLRKSIWALLEKLIDSPTRSDPVRATPESDPRTHDFTSMAINSPRGKAMQAVIEYARWVGMHEMVIEDGKEILPKKFDTMPEVRQLIEHQIDPLHSSFEVMSVLGFHFGLLFWIDNGWFQRVAGSICDLERGEKDPTDARGWAAWNTFLVWGRAHREYLRIFGRQYAYATSLASSVPISENNRSEPFVKLGEHLILLYGRGDLEHDIDNELIQTMVLRWLPLLRMHAMTFAGRTLAEQGEHLLDDIKQRFTALWSFYWNSTGPGDAKIKDESHIFGSWFSSGVFDPKWSLDELEKFVTVVPKPEPDHEIVERLAEIAEANLPVSVRILDRLVQGDDEGWRISHWEKHAYRLLEKAMAKPGEARTLAERVIDRLGRRGFMKFGDLLHGFAG